MRRVAQVATLGFGALMAFQVARRLARLWVMPRGAARRGASDGGAAIGSAAAVVFYAGSYDRWCGRDGQPERRYWWGTRALVVLLGMAALMNFASDSRWENFLLAPVALVLAGLCIVVARASRPSATRGSDGRLTPRHVRPLSQLKRQTSVARDVYTRPRRTT